MGGRKSRRQTLDECALSAARVGGARHVAPARHREPALSRRRARARRARRPCLGRDRRRQNRRRRRGRRIYARLPRLAEHCHERNRRIAALRRWNRDPAWPRTRGECVASIRSRSSRHDGRRRYRSRPRADAHDAGGPVRSPAVAGRERGVDRRRRAARQSRRRAGADRHHAAGGAGVAGFARAAGRLGETWRRACGRCCAGRSRSRSGIRDAVL